MYMNKLFKNYFLTLINNPTSVTSKSIFAIDHINTNFLLNSNFKSGIIKADLSYHFAIFMIWGWSETFFSNTEYRRNAQGIYKKRFSEKQIVDINKY